MQRLLVVLAVALIVAAMAAPGAEPSLQYWDLPTGSHIAVVHFGAGRNPTPVIYLHGDRLLAKDVRAAYALAPDAEMDGALDDFVNIAVRDTAVHDPALGKKLTMRGMGWWSYLMTNWDASSHPAGISKKLAGNRTPAIVVRGESDFIEPACAEDLRLFASARMIRIAKAGHIIWLEQPKALTEVLEGVVLAVK